MSYQRKIARTCQMLLFMLLAAVGVARTASAQSNPAILAPG